ncbi:MAG: hypothetical protein GQ570_07985 [Helicobacteraceae bacterium]|nr:hypothetical protein [Helicobacteraceae bacterium]
MKRLSNYSNFIIFLSVLTLFVITQPYNKFAFSLSSMLGEKEKEFVELAQEFSFSKTLLVSMKGFQQSDLEALEQISSKLSALDKISVLEFKTTPRLRAYKEKYKFYLSNLEYKNSNDVDIKKELNTIYDRLVSSSLYFSIDQQDPLSLFKKESVHKDLMLKNGHLSLGEYGYLAIFSLKDIATANSRVKLYNEIQTILNTHKNAKAFSPLFYYVENSKKTQNDVRVIVMTSMLFLGILYLLILRNFYLFLNVLTTLATSILLAQVILTYIFTSLSIIALAFATAITSVSIDYMFHHYLHNYYDQKKGFNRAVFYGFFTTNTAFILISFIEFTLIKQIALFSVISLTIAYVHFAFIYPHLAIKYKKPFLLRSYNTTLSLSSTKIVLLSFIVIVVSLLFVTFDFNVKNLDYQNKKLIADEKFFSSKLPQAKSSAILITASNINELILNSKMVHSIDPTAFIPMASLLSQTEYKQQRKKITSFNFSTLKEKIKIDSQNIGYKAKYFNNSYSNDLLYPTSPTYTQKLLKEFGFELINRDDLFITYTTIKPSKLNEVLNLNFTKSASSKTIFEKSLKKVYDELILYGSITLIFIILTLAIVTKKRFFSAITYILFPMAFILLYGVFTPLNIMHIFMSFVVLGIGIDYGIYMSEQKLSKNTRVAILYSLLSTFAGFGVLILSDINSLYSIAITACIGILAILFLLLFQKKAS